MDLSIKDLIDAGAHFGHSAMFGEPKMKPYIYAKRDGIHIIDLQKSLVLARTAMDFIQSVGEKRGRIIFVGTKKQAQEAIEKAAADTEQFFVTKKWLGGMLTNFSTIKESTLRLKKIEAMKERNELQFFSKAELIKIQKEYDRLYSLLKGIYDMNSLPAALFIVDIKKEKNAVAEARKLGIPIVAPVDTNCNPELIDYPIPANDDAKNSISLFLKLATEAYLEGRKNAKDVSAEEQMLEAEKTEAAKEGGKKGGPAAKAGPEVVKTSKGIRTMVAAGTADIVEIQNELEQESSKKDAASEDKENAASEDKEDAASADKEDAASEDKKDAASEDKKDAASADKKDS